jgi:hypothetical protein
MAAWGWSNPLELILGEGGWARFPNLQRWHAALSARPAALRAKELSAGPVTPMDEEARRHMFPQNARLAGSPNHAPPTTCQADATAGQRRPQALYPAPRPGSSVGRATD